MIVLEIIIGFYVTFGLLYGIGCLAGWFVRTLPVILVIPAIPFIDAYRMREEYPRMSKWIFALWLAAYILIAFGIIMECIS